MTLTLELEFRVVQGRHRPGIIRMAPKPTNYHSESRSVPSGPDWRVMEQREFKIKLKLEIHMGRMLFFLNATPTSAKTN